ncbi:MAG: hypothetical protein ACRENS_09685, partial [Candidatus Eiseniibacteriota bacterium]
MSKTIICPDCGHENPVGSTSCERCNFPFVAEGAPGAGAAASAAPPPALKAVPPASPPTPPAAPPPAAHAAEPDDSASEAVPRIRPPRGG